MNIRFKHSLFLTSVLSLLTGCMAPLHSGRDANPAKAYADKIKAEHQPVQSVHRPASQEPSWYRVEQPRASLRMVAGDGRGDAMTIPLDSKDQGLPPQLIPSPLRDYNGPLSIGDPGLSASLWRESSGPMNNIYHDYRAWQPMDLLTVVIQENAQGNKQANTRVVRESTFEAAISRLLGIERSIADRNTQLDPTALVSAETEAELVGQGQTQRQDKLTGTISVMVAEVLPSGILRVEGEKIITVNGEEQNMVLSGLVRTRDISSNNEVVSNKVANMRIDYYGKGALGDTQEHGWLTNILFKIWPF
jgi:flagellar L-ring protein FlgH